MSKPTPWKAPNPSTRREILADHSLSKSRNRTVVVTGASGLLGSRVALRLIARGYTVRCFQRRDAVAVRESLQEEGRSRFEQHRGSITNPGHVARALEGADAVIHLAAKVSVTGPWEEYVETNVTGTRLLLEGARSEGIRRFVYVSSPSVSHAGSSFMGQANEPADPSAARGNYARSKAYAERLALDYDAEDFLVGVVRPHLVWGPGDTQLVERIIERAHRGGIPLLDAGAALIDSTYVDNAAEAVVRDFKRLKTVHGKPLVISNGEPRTVGELMTMMCDAAGVQPPERRVPASLAKVAGSIVEKIWEKRPGSDEPPMTRFLAEQLSTSHWFDQRETRQLLGWTPEVSIDEGMRRLRRYYRPRTGEYTSSLKPLV
ncbi:NAD-dependent epimerase/dehydratase family protein [Kocuria massiliensis]|uniref:NAD-dependent epimerase/dehydratase family protein n=1 Tax=Kocuria massiliensis TaxID=1926282 RepID=UPI0022B9BD11|nr:NAD-dependent epimerase/dehydratase family protein [Kocuria massiliensis]